MTLPVFPLGLKMERGWHSGIFTKLSDPLSQ